MRKIIIVLILLGYFSNANGQYSDLKYDPPYTNSDSTSNETKSVSVAGGLAIAAGIGAIKGAVEYGIELIFTDETFSGARLAAYLTAGAAEGMATLAIVLFPSSVLVYVFEAATFQGVSDYFVTFLEGFYEDLASTVSDIRYVLSDSFKDDVNNLSTKLENQISSISQSLVEFNNSTPSISSTLPCWVDLNETIAIQNAEFTYSGMEYNSTYETWRMTQPGNSYLETTFELDNVPKDVYISLFHLTSYSESAIYNGYSPIDIFINGEKIKDDYDVALFYGDHSWHADDWSIESYLMVGSNTIRIELESNPWAATHYWIRSIYILEGKPKNKEPQITEFTCSQNSGNENTDFEFKVNYFDSDGDTPLQDGALLYIYGSTNEIIPMHLESGTSSNGTYSCTTKLPIGNCSYRFSFTNDKNQIVVSDLFDDIKVVNSADMTINVNMHCDEEGEGLGIEYKKNGETRYTSVGLLPEETISVSVEPSGSIIFTTSGNENYDFIKFKFTEPNGAEHEGTGNLLTINFSEFSNGIFELDVYYEYTPQLYNLLGTIKDVDGNIYTGNVTLTLESNQQNETQSTSSGSFNFSNVKGGVPITINPELSTNDENLYPNKFYVSNLYQNYSSINFIVESGDAELPILEIQEFPEEEVVSGNVQFVWNASDNVTESNLIQYSYFLTGLSTVWSDYNINTNVSYTLENGNYNFIVKAKDLAGNISEESYRFVVNYNPLIKVVEHEYGGSLSTRIKLNSDESETNSKVYLLPKHSVNVNESLVPLRLYRLNEKEACGCLSEVTNFLGLPTVFIDRGNSFEFIIPDTFPEVNELDYVIEWAYKANYGWSDKIPVEDGFLNLEPNSSYNVSIPDEVLDENLNMWRVAVRDRDMDRGKDAWAYIDMVNKDGIQIPTKQIAFEKGYYYTDDDYLHHDFEDAEIYDFGDSKVVLLDNEVNEEQGGVSTIDLEYRYKMIQLNNQGDVLNSKTGLFHQNARLILPTQKVNNAVWIFYSQNDDIYYEVNHKNTTQLLDYSLLYDTPVDHDVRFEELQSSFNGKAYVILRHYWRTDLSERRSQILLKILNSDGSGTVQTLDLGLILESDLVDFDDEYELSESTVDNLGRLWMLINHDYSSDPEKNLLVVIDQSGNLIMAPTETNIDRLGVCDKHGRIWAEDNDNDLTIVIDENFNSQSYSGGAAPPQLAGENLVNYDNDDYKLFDNESPYQFQILWNGQNYLDTCQFISTNTGLNISQPTLDLNAKNIFTSEEVIDSIISFSLKENLQVGMNDFKLEQSSLVGGEALVAFPPEINIPPRLVNNIDPIILNEDFGNYTVTNELDQIFYDENSIDISIHGSDTIVEYTRDENKLYLNSIENAQGEGEIYIIANDGHFFETDTIRYTILSVNDFPIIKDQSFSIDENVMNNTLIGSIYASDIEGDNISYTIKSGNINNTFDLDIYTGELNVNDSAELDYEKQQFIDLVIQVQDDGEGYLSDEAIVKININDIYENPDGINEFSFNDIQVKLFPIPVKDFLTIKISKKYNDKITAKLLDLNGITLYDFEYLSNSKTIDCRKLSSGVYLLKIIKNKEIKTIKFIKE